MVEAIERAGIGFMGPSSHVLRRAGAKDEAKKLARGLGNTVIPGVDDVSTRALLELAKDRKALEKRAKDAGLSFGWSAKESLEANAEAALQASYAAGVDLVGIADLQLEAERICAGIWRDYPTHRIRFKYIGGGGGLAQVDAKLPVTVWDCPDKACADAPTKSPAGKEVKLDAYKKLGQSFVGLNGGVVYAVSQNSGFQLNLNLMFMLPTTGQVIEPSLGYVIGL